VGLGVDTSGAPNREILRAWSHYLESMGGDYYAGAWKPSTYWLASEQRRWHVYALALAYLPDSAEPQVLGIDQIKADLYKVVTRFTEDSATSPMQSPTVRVTVFAQRVGHDWVFANALPRLTSTWRRRTIGPITYVMEPAYPFDARRAEGAARFTDSLASAFGVPRMPPLTYYLTSSSDEVYRIMGLETDKVWGPVGGVAQPRNHMLFSGNPAVGEDYRHELAHMVLLPLMGNTLYFVSEGVPTWVGGTTGMDFRRAAREFSTYLAEHLNVTLDSVVDGRLPAKQLYPGAAVFVSMVYDQGGTEAVKRLYNSGDDFRGAMERLFAKPWAAIVADWRDRVMSFGSAGTRSH